jgi:hypothetical protein
MTQIKILSNFEGFTNCILHFADAFGKSQNDDFCSMPSNPGLGPFPDRQAGLRSAKPDYSIVFLPIARVSKFLPLFSSLLCSTRSPGLRARPLLDDAHLPGSAGARGADRRNGAASLAAEDAGRPGAAATASCA